MKHKQYKNYHSRDIRDSKSKSLIGKEICL